jgi:hypothetical protein
MDAKSTNELGWQAMPTWQKAAAALAAVMIAPGVLLVAAVTGLSLFPLFLFGLWEGDGDQSPVHELQSVVRHARAHTDVVYHQT